MKKDSKNKLAASYADAMFEAARAAKAGSRVLSDVETLKSALEEDPKIVGMLANPLWKTDAKKSRRKRNRQSSRLERGDGKRVADRRRQ